jgi:SAM-dependent methyltransferase
VTEPYYSDSFYAGQCDGSLASARVVVPLLRELFNPQSVVDVGCGVGAWLAEFRREGVEDVVGLDGAWLNPNRLRIPEQAFRVVDLSRAIELERRFDLCLCLEVAEHLAEEHAQQLVDSLISLAPLVVFSAAIPLQTGIHHVNEQWPHYWACRFEKRGYVVLDCMRSRIWEQSAVQWWYAQNMLVFAQNDVLQQRPFLLDLAERTQRNMLDLVHPRMLAMVTASGAATLSSRSWHSYLSSLLRCRRERPAVQAIRRGLRP